MFIVGVAMPFSYARRAAAGDGPFQRTIHALFRALVLVLLGVFLSSNGLDETNWTFVNVLSQIGLGYLFAYLIMTLGRRFWIQLLMFILILAGYWGWFYSYTPPADYDYAAVGASGDEIFEGSFASWSKNANVAHHFDVMFLNSSRARRTNRLSSMRAAIRRSTSCRRSARSCWVCSAVSC